MRFASQQRRGMLSGRLAVIAAAAALPIVSSANAGAIADWNTFTSTTAQNWNTSGSWTAGTGIPTSGSTLAVNFDPSKAGTTTSSGRISASFTSNNDLAGNLQINSLNLAGESSSLTSVRTVTISGGVLQFGGTAPSISNTTTTQAGGTTGVVNYVVASNILLDANLGLSLGGTGLTTLVSSATSTLSANTAGLKTIAVSGAGNATIGNNSASVISDGNGQVGFVMNGTGTLSLGGANTYSGGVRINSGTVGFNSSSAGIASSLGTGTVLIGDTTGSANATFNFSKQVTITNPITVQAGSGGVKTIENSGGSSVAVIGALLTLNDDLVLKYSGGTTGSITIGSTSAGTWLTGAGDLTTESNGTSANTIVGTNPGFTGNVIVKSGSTRVNSDNSLSAANAVAVASGATFATNNRNQTIAGLNDVSGAGGTVTNVGANLRTLTLGGSGTYSFGGNITATTPANLALTVALTGGGSQTLTGSSTYTGSTTVSGGTLLVDGSLASGSAVTVGTGGTLGGQGTIGGPVTVNSTGRVSPGNGVGVLTISSTAALVIGSGAVYDYQIGSSSTDQISLTGTGSTVNFGGAWTLNVANPGSIDPTGKTFVLFDYTGSDPGNVGTPTVAFGAGTSGWSGGTVSVDSTNTRIILSGVVIPEPAATSLLGLAVSTGLMARWRRRA